MENKIKELISNNGIIDEETLLSFLNQNQFQWGLMIDGQKLQGIGPEQYSQIWQLKETEEFLNDKVAICRDYANFEKKVLDELGIENNLYYMVFGDNIKQNPAHSFTLLKKNGKIILIEYSFRQRTGIYYFNSEKEALHEMTEWLFLKFEYLRGQSVKVYKFNTVLPENITAMKLYNLACKQELINVLEAKPIQAN